VVVGRTGSRGLADRGAGDPREVDRTGWRRVSLTSDPDGIKLPRDVVPRAPAPDLGQHIRADDEAKAVTRVRGREVGQRLDRVAGDREFAFDFRDPHPVAEVEGAAHRHAGVEGREGLGEGVSKHRNEPHLVRASRPPHPGRHHRVADMRRVEAAAIDRDHRHLPLPRDATRPTGYTDPMQRQTPARAAAVLAALYLAGLGAGAVAGTAAVARAQDPYTDLDRLARFLTVIEADYVEPVSLGALVDAALRGMTDHLDPHSRWLSAAEATDLVDETAGQVTGIGVDLRVDAGAAEVVRVLPNSPASRDGVAAGDRIVAIDGQPLHALSPEAVTQALTGAQGTPITVTVARGGTTADIRTVRDRLDRSPVDGGLLAGGIAVVHLAQFSEGAARDVEAELQRLEARHGAPLAGAVLDLRDNPGGLLSEAVAVADLFLDEGPIVSTRGRDQLAAADGSTRDHHEATLGGWPGLPLAVLVNGGSASAAEIVAAALQDTRRAALVGTQTYGKGSVQRLYRHADGSALKLTVARYYTASGAPVSDHQGRVPDVVVAWPGEPGPRERLRARLATTALAPADRDALAALVDGLPADPPSVHPIAWTLPFDERAPSDPQLAAAVRALAR
jgi:carboxyl-terminal processing protease